MSWRSRTAVVVAFLAGAVGLRVFRAVRDGDAIALSQITSFNRQWANPLMLRFAGSRPWAVARLEHRGRLSGALRVTPVWAEPVRGGFLILMPYGVDVDWAKNLLTAGEGVVQRDDVRYRVGSPVVVPAASALVEFPAVIRLLAEVMGVRNVMRVETLPALTVEAPPPA